MKILAFDGSPRKNGNSTMLLRAFIRGAEEGGAEYEMFKTDSLELEACRGCLMCNTLKRCALRNDAWEELSAKILEADVLVFSSPIYFHHTTASMKRLIDRFRSFIHVQITADGLIHTPHQKWNKSVCLLTAHGSPAAEEAHPLIDLFKFMTEAMGPLNDFHNICAVRLAVSGQISYEQERLELLYQKLAIPPGLAADDALKNRNYLLEAERLGQRVTAKRKHR